MNDFRFEGKVTKEPIFKIVKTKNDEEIAILKFTIVAKNSENAQKDFLPLTLFDEKAEKYSEIIKEGSVISGHGKIALKFFTRKADNKKSSSLDIVVFDLKKLNNERSEKTTGQVPNSFKRNELKDFE